MKVTFQHNLLSDCILFFDHYMCKEGEAFNTYETNFYNYADDSLNNNVVFGAPYKSWVYDKSVANAQIEPVVSGNNGLIAAGTSGMKIDYINGRILFDSGFSTSENISGRYSVKEFNTYPSNENEENLVIENKYKQNSRYGRDLTYVNPYSPVTPAAFISTKSFNNKPFAFGGFDNSVSNITAVIFAENIYQLDGYLSLAADMKDKLFRNIGFTGSPFDEYGDIKSVYTTGFDYNNAGSNNMADWYIVEDVRTSKFSDKANKEIQPNLFVGFVDLEVHKYRYI